MPQINLPQFDDDIFHWLSVYSLNTSIVLALLVLSWKEIFDTKKFHYVISGVQNEHRSLIQHLPMTVLSVPRYCKFSHLVSIIRVCLIATLKSLGNQ